MTYRLELSPDLIFPAWTNGGYVVVMPYRECDPDFYAVTNRIPIRGNTSGFVRLVIEQSE